MKRYLLMLLVVMLVAGCSDEDKGKIAKLEAENQQLKTNLQIMQAEHPLVDLEKLQKFGRDQLGSTLPDVDREGFLTSRAALAGVNSTYEAMKTVTPQSKFETILRPLYVLEDMWPAHVSAAGEKIDPVFRSCRNLPTLTRMSVEAVQNNMGEVASKLDEVAKLIKFQCSFVLSAAVIKSQEKK
ncbi:hypothetical protein [Gulbenkiania mobilis]|uniref:hypothetical protein n=1 Tax=Gulbenkiania mobilis TaxID=397457 RepID=UPI0006BBE324|nr:hypothetical protein [Gulbenkiania mobilis]